MLLGCSQSPSIAPCHTEEPPYISLLFLCFCSAGSNQHKIWAAGVKSVFIWEAGWEEPFIGNNSTFSCFRNLEIMHVHPFVAAYIFKDTHPETYQQAAFFSYSLMLSLRASSKQTFSFSLHFSLLHTSVSCFL